MLNVHEFRSDFFSLTVHESGAILAELNRDQLTEQDNLEQLDREFVSLVETFGVRKLAVDLVRLSYLTSSAIGKFIALHRRLNRLEGKLVLCSAGEEVRQILESAHLWTYFNIASSPGDASLLLSA